jgi:hypothetical protein
MKTTRKEILANLQKVMAKIKDIKDRKGKLVLKSGNLFLEDFGCLQDIEDTNKLLYIYVWLSEYAEKVAKSAKELSIGESDIEKIEIQGLLIADWKEDVKGRVNQLNEKTVLKKLKVAQEIMEKHLSEDDAFTLDMSKVEAELANVNLD